MSHLSLPDKYQEIYLKSFYRIYNALELNLRIRLKKRLLIEKPELLTASTEINHLQSMDLMHDQLHNGRSFKLFNIIDYLNREASAIKIELLLP